FGAQRRPFNQSLFSSPSRAPERDRRGAYRFSDRISTAYLFDDVARLSTYVSHSGAARVHSSFLRYSLGLGAVVFFAERQISRLSNCRSFFDPVRPLRLTGWI